MNSYVLLAEVFSSSNSHKLAAGCWIAAISFHPQYPELWQKLGKTYGELLQENLQKLCLTRAKRLTASFDKKLPESFVKNTYSADISTEKSNQDVDDGFNDLGKIFIRSTKFDKNNGNTLIALKRFLDFFLSTQIDLAKSLFCNIIIEINYF